MSPLGRLFKPNIKKLLIQKNVLKLIEIVLDQHSDVESRQFAAQALGQIREAQAVEPLGIILKSNIESLELRLACYAALEALQYNFLETEVKNLVESVVAEIRAMYSRTEVIQEEYIERKWLYPSDHVTSEEVIPEIRQPNPDISGIKTLITLVPNALIERVRLMSGEAANLF
jgi:hypothetical protein